MHSRKDFAIDSSKLLDEEFLNMRTRKQRILAKLLDRTLPHYIEKFDVDWSWKFDVDWSWRYLKIAYVSPGSREDQDYQVYWMPPNESLDISKPLALERFTRASMKDFCRRSPRSASLEFLEDLVEFMFSNALVICGGVYSLDPKLTSLDQIYMLADLSRDSVEYS